MPITQYDYTGFVIVDHAADPTKKLILLQPYDVAVLLNRNTMLLNELRKVHLLY